MSEPIQESDPGKILLDLIGQSLKSETPVVGGGECDGVPLVVIVAAGGMAGVMKRMLKDGTLRMGVRSTDQGG